MGNQFLSTPGGGFKDPTAVAVKQVRTRNSEVRQLLDSAAGGAEITDEEIEQAIAHAPDNVRDEAFDLVRDAADHCNELYAQGRMGEARRHAQQMAEEIAALIGPAPSNRQRPDPREEAAKISRTRF